MKQARILKITNSAGSGWLAVDASSLDGAYAELNELLSGGEIGDSLTIKLEEMPEDEFKNLREFDGW